jgi:hypothetical protein
MKGTANESRTGRPKISATNELAVRNGPVTYKIAGFAVDVLTADNIIGFVRSQN